MAEVDTQHMASRTAGSAPAPAVEGEYLPYALASDLENGSALPFSPSEKTSKSPSPSCSNGNANETPPNPQQQNAHAGVNGGYMRLAKWMAGCDDFFVIRKFSALTAFMLLKVQDDLVQLEQEISELDLKRSRAAIGGDSFRGDDRERLSVLVDGEVLPKLKVYYEMLNSLHAVHLRGTATPRQWLNLHNWFNNHPTAIHPSQTTFKDTSDLIAVHQRPRSTIWSLVEKYAQITRFLIPRFPVTTTTNNTNGLLPTTLSPTTHRFRVKRIDQFVAFTVIIIGYVLLFVPIWLEEFYQGTRVRIGIVMAFTALFAVFSVSATTSLTRGFETLAATAAYTAVLMVFLQNGS